MLTATKLSLLPLSLILVSLIFAAKAQSSLTTDIGDKRYRFVTTQKRNWYQANHACTALGMSLAAIESETEYTNMKNYLFNNNLVDDFWLSGNNLADSTVYAWLSSGNKFNYTAWSSTPGAENCVYTGAQYKWTTAVCTDPKYFICSRPLIPNCGITGRCKRNLNFFY